MTGAGFAAGDTEVGELRIEVRSVNGRGLALKQRLAPNCAPFEAAIEARVRERLRRGSVLVVIERARAASGSLPDRDVLESVARELRELAEALQLPELRQG